MAERKRWLIPLLIGFVLTIVACFAYAWLFPRPSPEEENMARGFQMEPRTAQRINRLLKGIEERKRPLSDSDWSEIRRYSESANWGLRGWGVLMMSRMATGPRRAEIVAIARSRLNDSASFVRANAMSALYRAGDPSWREQALSLQNDPDETLRSTSRILLHKEWNRLQKESKQQ